MKLLRQRKRGLQWHQKEIALGPFRLTSGEVLEDARLIWWQRGEVNAPKDNLVLLPTYYGGDCQGVTPLGELQALADGALCLLVPAMLGMGESTSPSNATNAQRGQGFPTLDVADNIHLQHRWLEQLWPGYRLKLVAGWSMGGLQSLHWAALYPKRVERLASWCASARCHPQNRMFLYGLEAALRADPQLGQAGLRAFARVYAGWAYGPAFYREGMYRELGCDNEEALLAFWDEDHLQRDPHDLLVVLNAWRGADIGRHGYAGTTEALAAIEQPALIGACDTDRYFLAEEIESEAAAMPNARFTCLRHDWGHIAGGPGRVDACMAQLDAELEELMAR